MNQNNELVPPHITKDGALTEEHARAVLNRIKNRGLPHLAINTETREIWGTGVPSDKYQFVETGDSLPTFINLSLWERWYASAREGSD